MVTVNSVVYVHDQMGTPVQPEEAAGLGRSRARQGGVHLHDLRALSAAGVGHGHGERHITGRGGVGRLQEAVGEGGVGGKVERFNHTLLDEWACLRPYSSNHERTAAPADFLHTYDHHHSTSHSTGAHPSAASTTLRVNTPGGGVVLVERGDAGNQRAVDVEGAGLAGTTAVTWPVPCG